MKRLLLIALACGLGAAGCASKPYMEEQRQAPTGLAAGERIAILLSSYEEEWNAVARPSAQWDEIEERLASCLKEPMTDQKRGLLFISARDARASLFPGTDIGEIPAQPADWLQTARSVVRRRLRRE